MTVASGKGKCMFVSKISLRYLNLLIPLSLLVCVTHLSAQQADKPDEWEMDLSLPSAARVAEPDNSGLVLPDEDQNQSLQQLFSSLAVDPGDTAVLEQLSALMTDVLLQANNMMDRGSLEEAAQLLPIIQSIDPGLSGLSVTSKRLQSLNEAIELVNEGNAALESHQILEPENDSAFYYFKQALRKAPGNVPAQVGLAEVQDALVERALHSAHDLDYEMADAWLLDAATIRQDQRPVENAYFEVAKLKQEHANELERKAIAAMESGEFTLADFYIIDLIALGEQEFRIEPLRVKLTEARFYGGFEPGEIITDELLKTGGHAPELVIVSAGSFLMGSKEGSDGVLANEKPRHRVTIEHGFALGTREVSVAEFRLFINSSGYRTAAERAGSSSVYDEAAGRLTNRKGVDWQYDYVGRKAEPDLPVLHVNLHDAQAYAQWLSDETGKAYRLPSEAEYEYVARAGGKGTYWWGEGSPAEAVENLTGVHDKSPSNRRWTTYFKKYGDGHWGAAPTASIASGKLTHPMGVYDITGNVSEWTQDCWHQNYMKAPVDGSAWINPGCDRCVVRGGYWASSPAQARAAFRISAKAETYGPVVGIRIARDL